ncbi:T9SS type A sorting domain-containing protein [Taibaiella lutea]|uniref:T9SS type A sorting domain-containing protein n=1 Tax=Taibaiella lutea TaxID=2608001 RepID=A0A5M6CN89_9BACT|nr:MbnP family protein [Taibaiella lutea]KAA5536513.1 T9SS type A sorting domain-containing protein [Taibaiella lutea]
MKKILFLLISIITFSKINAQKNVTLNITHKLGANNFAFNTTAQNDLTQNFQITRVDYYISGIKIIHDGGQITPVPNYIMVKGSYNVSEPLGSLNVTNVEGIKFSIGVDTPENNADPSTQFGPLGFQTPSMHWGWAAGYRFVALEGKAGNNFNTEFQLHGLWNENYFQQTVMAPGVVNGDNITINLDADYTQALKGIDVASGPLLHGVNTADLDMLKNFRDHVFKPGSGSTAINELSVDKNIRIYPNPGKKEIHIDLSNSSGTVSQYKIMNMQGAVTESGNVLKSNVIALKNTAPGNYVLALYNKGILVSTQMLVIE